MTVPADPALPQDPAQYRRPIRRGLNVGVAAGAAVLCLLAGYAVATLGPRVLAARPDLPALFPPAPPVSPSQAALAAAPIPSLPAPAPLADGGMEVARLNARIAELEANEARTADAAAEVLAAAALLEASQDARPFSAELSALRAVSPGSPELAALAALAQTGAPTRAALAASFPAFAARAASAARRPGEDAALGERLAYQLSRVVSLRNVAEPSGATSDAVLVRAERALEAGDVAAALRETEALPPAAQAALAPWREQAGRRAEIDRRAAQLRARALQDLQAQRNHSAGGPRA